MCACAYLMIYRSGGERDGRYSVYVATSLYILVNYILNIPTSHDITSFDQYSFYRGSVE